MKLNKRISVLIAVFLSGLMSVACGSESNPSPDDDDDFVGDDDEDDDEDDDGDDDDGPGPGPGPGFEERELEPCEAEPNGRQPSGSAIAGRDCWDLTECNGINSVQFLNQCNAGQCFPFDNTRRIQGYSGGALPPL